jgi:uncharacterized repeat protein (TIGR01451 family)
MLMRTAIAMTALAAVLAPASSASADDVVFGSPLNDPANAMPFRHGWDQTVFSTAGPVAIAAPKPGLIRQVRLRGFAADGQPLAIKFRVIRPVAMGRWRAIATPMVASLPPADGIHVFNVPDPRAFRVQAGDYVAVFQQGFGGAGRQWQIFATNSAWTMQKVAIDGGVPGTDNGFNDGDLSPARPADLVGNSTVSYPGYEVLLQAVEAPDLCPGTDLPQQPCRSKLYLGGKVAKSGRALRYTWTLRNGGPHPASGLSFVANLPARTTLAGVPARCTTTPGPPLQVRCDVGDIPAPQEGNAVRRISFVAVPHKATRFFRATGVIDAPSVDDPNGAAHHVKTVSASTRKRKT